MNIKRFISFKQGYTTHLGKAPHKPILMLAIIEAIENGLVTDNKFAISPELVGYFKGYWNKLVTTGHTPNFALPYYHLQNEKSQVWKLKTIEGFDQVLTSSNSVKSLSSLSSYVLYGSLANEFFNFLLIHSNRAIVKTLIIEKYFQTAKAESNMTVDYLQEIDNQILGDTPLKYSQRIKELKNVTKEQFEEESFLREASFKKLIPKLYNNTCAISRMRVDTTLNASLIDACHIVPWSESHDDTVTNGISLSPNLHRAFDRGLISINNDYQVILSDSFVESDSPYNFSQFRNARLLLPESNKTRPSRENLENHRKRWGFE